MNLENTYQLIGVGAFIFPFALGVIACRWITAIPELTNLMTDYIVGERYVAR